MSVVALLLIVIVAVVRGEADSAQFLPFQHLLGHSESFAMLWSAPLNVAQRFLSNYDATLCLAPQNLTVAGTHPVRTRRLPIAALSSR
jgi:hypothetical protein